MSDLTWPEEFERTDSTERVPYPHNFQVSTTEAFDNIVEELLKFDDLKKLRIETAHSTVKSRPDEPGTEVTTRSTTEDDPGVVAYWWRDGEEFAAPCDQWDSIRDNAQAIYHYIKAKRGMERWGVETIVSEYEPQRRTKRRVDS